ncbi:electron transfer flavoprotein subunit beta/FixA family protein [Chengkuizengella marina]|uniref:Electron transfer flavoprotein small subunit n=1 Tax=Chengkuizengella marina TaxID=2507566 RepID=A0A6N9PXE3_9BACL|nr:electron transfer flavoprotein subunit beta/FixA family protein [Chengkuizengella marina]NBI27576.1 electron transfer flavoprotein subunit beta/FixA family protein [Chengkuizengella marina]
MHIVVCVKQVPDTRIIKVNPKTNTLDRRGIPAILNPFDSHAVEAGVRLKEKVGGTVSVLSMGPPNAVKMIRKCVEIGADEGYLISDRFFAGADTLATSYALYKAFEKMLEEKPVDIIICGKQTIDGDTGQVGPGIARRLDIPPITNVIEIKEVDEKAKKVVVKRKLEDGYEMIESSLPCLLTVEKDINPVSYSPLPNMIKAARYEPTIWKVDDLNDVDKKQLGLKGSPTIVAKMFAPPKLEGGKKIEGNAEQQSKQIVSLLLEKPELFEKKRGRA